MKNERGRIDNYILELDSAIATFLESNGFKFDDSKSKEEQVAQFLAEHKYSQKSEKDFKRIFKKIQQSFAKSLSNEEESNGIDLPKKQKRGQNVSKKSKVQLKDRAFLALKKMQYKLIPASDYERRKQICLEAVSRDGMALDYFREFQTDADCVYAAVKNNPWAYGHARIEGYNSQTDGKNDLRIVAEVFKSDYRCIRFIGERFSEKWYNVEIMLHFRPELFQFFADNLRNDPNYCLSKMSQITTDFYKYVHPNLYKNGHFMVEAYGMNKACFEKLDISLKKDGRFILNCIDRYGKDVLAYADKSLYKNRAFMRELLSKHPKAVDMIGILGINNDDLFSIVAKDLVELWIINKDLIDWLPESKYMQKKILKSYEVCLTDKKLTRKDFENLKNTSNYHKDLDESRLSILEYSRAWSEPARAIEKMDDVSDTIKYNANEYKKQKQREAAHTTIEYVTFVWDNGIKHANGRDYSPVEIARMSVEQRQMLDLMMKRGVKQVCEQSYIGIDITDQTTLDQLDAFLEPAPKTMTTPANIPLVLTRFDSRPRP